MWKDVKWTRSALGERIYHICKKIYLFNVHKIPKDATDNFAKIPFFFSWGWASPCADLSIGESRQKEKQNKVDQNCLLPSHLPGRQHALLLRFQVRNQPSHLGKIDRPKYHLTMYCSQYYIAM